MCVRLHRKMQDAAPLCRHNSYAYVKKYITNVTLDVMKMVRLLSNKQASAHIYIHTRTHTHTHTHTHTNTMNHIMAQDSDSHVLKYAQPQADHYYIWVAGEHEGTSSHFVCHDAHKYTHTQKESHTRTHRRAQ